MGMIDFELKDVGGIFTSLREAITGKKIVDPVEMLRLGTVLDRLQNAILVGQIDINKIEAAHPSIFVSGWRPFVGWSCGFALCYVSILEPIGRFIAVVGFGYAGEFPQIDTVITMQVLLGLLGIGGMRTFDKLKGVDTKQVGK